MSNNKSALFFMGLSLLVFGAHCNIVDSIVPCHINDNECMLESAKKVIPHFVNGYPELGIPAVEPLTLSKVNADNGDLKLEFQNMTVKGLSLCKLRNMKRIEKLKATIVAECPISMNGFYKLDGLFSLLRIDGNGPCEISADKILITLNITLKVIDGKDGKQHYKISKFHYEYDPTGTVKFVFENLCGGDKVRAEPFNKILSDEATAKDLIRTMGKPVIKEIIVTVVFSVDKFLSNVPSDQLELS